MHILEKLHLVYKLDKNLIFPSHFKNYIFIRLLEDSCSFYLVISADAECIWWESNIFDYITRLLNAILNYISVGRKSSFPKIFLSFENFNGLI